MRLASHATELPVTLHRYTELVDTVDLVAPAVRGVAVEPVRNRCGPGSARAGQREAPGDENTGHSSDQPLLELALVHEEPFRSERFTSSTVMKYSQQDCREYI